MKKEFLKAFQDFLKEESDGKYSTKKLWGHVVMLLVCMTYVLDGWDFYSINQHLFDSMLIAGTTLLSMTVVRAMINKRRNKQKPDEDENS